MDLTWRAAATDGSEVALGPSGLPKDSHWSPSWTPAAAAGDPAATSSTTAKGRPCSSHGCLPCLPHSLLINPGWSWHAERLARHHIPQKPCAGKEPASHMPVASRARHCGCRCLCLMLPLITDPWPLGHWAEGGGLCCNAQVCERAILLSAGFHSAQSPCRSSFNDRPCKTT